MTQTTIALIVHQAITIALVAAVTILAATHNLTTAAVSVLGGLGAISAPSGAISTVQLVRNGKSTSNNPLQ